FCRTRPRPTPPLFPYTPLFRSVADRNAAEAAPAPPALDGARHAVRRGQLRHAPPAGVAGIAWLERAEHGAPNGAVDAVRPDQRLHRERRYVLVAVLHARSGRLD